MGTYWTICAIFYKSELFKNSLLKNYGPGMVAKANNLSNLGDRGKRIEDLDQPGEGSMRHYLKYNSSKAVRAEGGSSGTVLA
jgi:hypothetical protein